MDVQPTQQQQPVSDDNELAKVLAGVDEKLADDSTPVDDSAQATPEPITPQPQTAPAIIPSLDGVDLEPIKKAAIEELRPLVEKLNLPPEEKFDIYLLIIRSTDDQTLIDPAHEAAKNIADETRRAQALLDIIKEIEFFSHPQAPAGPEQSADTATPQPL